MKKKKKNLQWNPKRNCPWKCNLKILHFFHLFYFLIFSGLCTSLLIPTNINRTQFQYHLFGAVLNNLISFYFICMWRVARIHCTVHWYRVRWYKVTKQHSKNAFIRWLLCSSHSNRLLMANSVPIVFVSLEKRPTNTYMPRIHWGNVRFSWVSTHSCIYKTMQSARKWNEMTIRAKWMAQVKMVTTNQHIWINLNFCPVPHQFCIRYKCIHCYMLLWKHFEHGESHQ